MARKRKGRRVPAEPVRFPIDLKVFLSALAWQEGCNIPEAVDLVVREPIVAAFNKLPQTVRDRYMRVLAESSPTAA